MLIHNNKNGEASKMQQMNRYKYDNGQCKQILVQYSAMMNSQTKIE